LASSRAEQRYRPKKGVERVEMAVNLKTAKALGLRGVATAGGG
jgi:hypothetical protein